MEFSRLFKIFVVILIFYPVNSFAEYKWKKIGRNTSGTIFYVDLLSIKKFKNSVYVFNLIDYVKPTEQGTLSSKAYLEYNCANFNYKLLKDFYYDKPMGNGEPIAVISEESEWYENKKGSISEMMGKFACNYK